jgi:hypothetical protein
MKNPELILKRKKEKILKARKKARLKVRLKKQRDKERLKKKIAKEKEKQRWKKRIDAYKRDLAHRREKYKPIKIKNQRRKQNKRYYDKKRSAILAEKKANGDRYGYFRIILTRDYQMYEELGHAKWFLNGYNRYTNYIQEHNKDVICEKIILKNEKCRETQERKEVKYEILLIEKINPKTDNGEREIRNEYGMYTTNVISNNENYAIIAKNDWYIPETYHVYGYHPSKDRKTGRWIYDNIITHEHSIDNMKNIFYYKNKLIVQHNNDIDIIICKTKNEAKRLYDKCEQLSRNVYQYLFFTGEINKGRIKWLIQTIQEKTGWTYNKIIKNES